MLIASIVFSLSSVLWSAPPLTLTPDYQICHAVVGITHRHKDIFITEP